MQDYKAQPQGGKSIILFCAEPHNIIQWNTTHTPCTSQGRSQKFIKEGANVTVRAERAGNFVNRKPRLSLNLVANI